MIQDRVDRASSPQTFNVTRNAINNQRIFSILTRFNDSGLIHTTSEMQRNATRATVTSSIFITGFNYRRNYSTAISNLT